jgi:hypothetical protein
MAKYLSIVKAVIVNTVALLEVSAASPRPTQKTSPKTSFVRTNKKTSHQISINMVHIEDTRILQETSAPF